MTTARRDELRRRANALIEDLLTLDICLSETECLVLQNRVSAALIQVENEVWEKCINKWEEFLAIDNVSTDDQVWRYINWCRAQEIKN